MARTIGGFTYESDAAVYDAFTGAQSVDEFMSYVDGDLSEAVAAYARDVPNMTTEWAHLTEDDFAEIAAGMLGYLTERGHA